MAPDPGIESRGLPSLKPILKHTQILGGAAGQKLSPFRALPPPCLDVPPSLHASASPAGLQAVPPASSGPACQGLTTGSLSSFTEIHMSLKGMALGPSGDLSNGVGVGEKGADNSGGQLELSRESTSFLVP